MAQYIDKSALVAEIEKRISLFQKEKKTEKCSAGASQINIVSLGARIAMLEEIISFLDTLEVKEIHEDIDVDLNPFFEELGVESDSRLASMIKKAFYEGIDKILK